MEESELYWNSADCFALTEIPFSTVHKCGEYLSRRAAETAHEVSERLTSCSTQSGGPARPLLGPLGEAQLLHQGGLWVRRGMIRNDEKQCQGATNPNPKPTAL